MTRIHRITTAFLVAATGIASSTAWAAPEEFVIDPIHTHVHWEVRHFGTSTSRGRFDAIAGSLMLDRQARSGSASISIGTASVSTGFTPFDGVLKGSYLLSVVEHPTAYFVATKFTFDGTQLTTVRGEFTLRGVSDAVTLHAQRFLCRSEPLPTPHEICGGDFEAHIKRSVFGLTHSLPFVDDTVRILVRIQASRQLN